MTFLEYAALGIVAFITTIGLCGVASAFGWYDMSNAVVLAAGVAVGTPVNTWIINTLKAHYGI